MLATAVVLLAPSYGLKRIFLEVKVRFMLTTETGSPTPHKSVKMMAMPGANGVHALASKKMRTRHSNLMKPHKVDRN